jgi:hypothetical protein
MLETELAADARRLLRRGGAPDRRPSGADCSDTGVSFAPITVGASVSGWGGAPVEASGAQLAALARRPPSRGLGRSPSGSLRRPARVGPVPRMGVSTFYATDTPIAPFIASGWRLGSVGSTRAWGTTVSSLRTSWAQDVEAL